MGTILGIVTAVAPMLFRLVEKKFGSGTGDAKMKTVVNSIMPILEALAAAGRLGGSAPGADELTKMLEELLRGEKAKSDWKETGELRLGGKRFIVTVEGAVE